MRIVFNICMNLTFSSLFCINSEAQSKKLSYEWIACSRAGAYINNIGMAVDEHENIYLVGKHEDNVQFVSAATPKVLFHSGRNSGNYYQYLAKFNKEGEICWVQKLVGVAHHSDIYDVCVDRNGKIYITGYLGHYSIFSSASAGDTVLQSTGDCTFAARYNADGKLEKIFTNTKFRFSTKIRVDDQGNIYLCNKQPGQGLEIVILNSEGTEVYSGWWAGMDVKDYEINRKGTLYCLYVSATHLGKPDFAGFSPEWSQTQYYGLVQFSLNKKPELLLKREVIPDIDGGVFNNFHLWYSSEEYANQVCLDDKGEPRLAYLTYLRANETKEVFGIKFNYNNNDRVILMVFGKNGKPEWVQKMQTNSYFNTHLIYTKNGWWLVTPMSGTVHYGSDSVEAADYGPNIHELMYAKLDSKGRIIHAIRGGGTASNYHATNVIANSVGSLFVASDIVGYAVLKENDTLRGPKEQSLFYLAKIGANHSHEKFLASHEINSKEEISRATLTPQPASTNEKLASGLVFLYPNPTAEKATLVIQWHQPVAEATLIISSSNGANILSQTVKLVKGENNIPIDLSGFASGYYTAQLTVKGEIYRRKVIKQ